MRKLAQRLEIPGGARGGLANGCIPFDHCSLHRVIGSDGSLTGFGGGLANKRKLLDLESRQLSLL